MSQDCRAIRTYETDTTSSTQTGENSIGPSTTGGKRKPSSFCTLKASKVYTKDVVCLLTVETTNEISIPRGAKPTESGIASSMIRTQLKQQRILRCCSKNLKDGNNCKAVNRKALGTRKAF